jgi:hypothetical protein
MLFIINIVSVAIFRDGLSPRLGAAPVYFCALYFIFSFFMDIFRPYVAYKAADKKIKTLIVIFTEIFAAFLSAAMIFFIMPLQYREIEWRDADMRSFFMIFTYLLYIILFNSVTFFTVEFAISRMKEEYKKNHTKYYFRYNAGKFKRFFYVLRSGAPEALKKIQKNVCWLIFFVITAETIFETPDSIGINLLDGYNSDSVLLLQNVFYILFVIVIINSITDFFIELSKKTKKTHVPISEPVSLPKFSITKKYLILALVFLAVFLGLLLFNYQEYAIAGYYDFEVNSQRTLADIVEKYNLSVDSAAAGDIKSGLKLCAKGEKGYGYNIVTLKISDPSGNTHDIIPFYEKTDRKYYYIENLKNMQKKQLNGTILAVSSTLKYETWDKIFSLIPFLGKENTAFRLQADTSKSAFSIKPLYLISLFYLFYFLTLLLAVFIVSKAVYFSVVKDVLYGVCGQKQGIILRGAKKLLFYSNRFFNSFTLIMVFFATNMAIQNNMSVQWENEGFFLNAAVYFIFQLLLSWMISDSLRQEIELHAIKIFGSDEFKYYREIGMAPEGRYKIYNSKYGKRLFIKVLIQNVFLTLNINYFVSYAFNTWSAFKDNIGLTYAISFENIFTKTVHLRRGSAPWYDFFIYIMFYILLFGLYMYFQKKEEKRG